VIDPQNTQLSSAKKILEGEYNLKKRGGPTCTIADMFLARIWGVFLICYISKGDGTSGKDQPFIVAQHEGSRAGLGPPYRVENSTGLHILGPQVHTVVEGQELALVCRDSIGTASLAWRKKGGLMPIGASMVNGGQVIVERASRDDAGMYECWDTSGEAASKTKQVRVLFPPKVSVTKVWVVGGGEDGGLTLHLVCRVDAEPAAQGLWSREDGLAGWSIEHSQEARVSVVSVRSPGRSSHWGTFLCKARNPLGQDSAEITLTGFEEQASQLRSRSSSPVSLSKELQIIFLQPLLHFFGMTAFFLFQTLTSVAYSLVP